MHLSPGHPLRLVRPVARHADAEATLAASTFVSDMDGLTAYGREDDRRTMVAPPADPDRAPGACAVAAHKRARGACPFAGAVG